MWAYTYHMGIHVSTKSASGTSLELSKSIKIWKRFGFWNKVATHVVTQVNKDIGISYALKQDIWFVISKKDVSISNKDLDISSPLTNELRPHENATPMRQVAQIC
jgi:hypothetical protein